MDHTWRTRAHVPRGGKGREGARAEVRVLQALPVGEEVVISYVPVDWEREARREHVEHVFGFECTCDRCRVEAVSAFGRGVGW